MSAYLYLRPVPVKHNDLDNQEHGMMPGLWNLQYKYHPFLCIHSFVLSHFCLLFTTTLWSSSFSPLLVYWHLSLPLPLSPLFLQPRTIPLSSSLIKKYVSCPLYLGKCQHNMMGSNLCLMHDYSPKKCRDTCIYPDVPCPKTHPPHCPNEKPKNWPPHQKRSESTIRSNVVVTEHDNGNEKTSCLDRPCPRVIFRPCPKACPFSCEFQSKISHHLI